MTIKDKKLVLSDDDLKEIFALFTSPTAFEKEQVYAPDSGHHFSSTRLSEEYALTQDKREYALDAWRAVLFFLQSHGFSLVIDSELLDLSWVEEEFLS